MAAKPTLNQQYLTYLKKYPLLTKSATAAVLAILNEIIASTISKEFNVSKVLGLKIKHPLTWKLPIFALFAASVNAPLNHYGLKFVNHIVKPPLTFKKKVLQILLSLTTFAPVLNVLFVAFIATMNLNPVLQSFSVSELKRAFENIKISLKRSLFAVVKSSWVTTPLVLTICQKYLVPEYWAVFSNIVYFILGTGQNTLLKSRNKKNYEYQKKKDEVKADAEKEASDGENDSTNNLSIIEVPSEKASIQPAE